MLPGSKLSADEITSKIGLRRSDCPFSKVPKPVRVCISLIFAKLNLMNAELRGFCKTVWPSPQKKVSLPARDVVWNVSYSEYRGKGNLISEVVGSPAGRWSPPVFMIDFKNCAGFLKLGTNEVMP